jgi:hypothetical protein
VIVKGSERLGAVLKNELVVAFVEDKPNDFFLGKGERKVIFVPEAPFWPKSSPRFGPFWQAGAEPSGS